MLTHRVDGANFDFMALMHESLDVDFSKVRRIPIRFPTHCEAKFPPPSLSCSPWSLRWRKTSPACPASDARCIRL